VLFLTRPAFRLLAGRGHLADYPDIGWANMEKRARVSEFTLRHELDVMDVRAAVWKAITADPRYEIVEFCTWPLLYQFQAAPGPGQPDVMLRPDGFLHIAERDSDSAMSEHLFFLEVDRSTETQATLGSKAACYANFYRRGGMASRCGGSREQYKKFPFRVLIAVRNTERRNNAAEQILQCTPPLLTQVWLSTLDELKGNPLGKIWMQPADYRAAVANTNFAVPASPPNPPAVYQRRVEREVLVDRRVVKRSLFDSASPLSNARSHTARDVDH